MPGQNPYFYYQPSQLGMRVSSKGDTPNTDAIASSWDFINSEAKRLFDYKDVAFPAPADNVRQFSFTLQTDQGAVTKTFAFRGGGDSDIFAAQDLPTLVEHINNSDDQRKKDSGLEMVDLNWLACGAGNGNFPGDGGPGGPPYPFPPVGDPLPNPIPYKFRGKLIDELSKQRSRGAGISVAILDTAPSKDALNAAYAQWVTGVAGAKHPLLERLWDADGANPRLHIQWMSQPTRDRLKTYSMEDHQYSIIDHGLFVAGIIDTLAPDAKLYLYEALNDRGVCDSESVLAGLEWIQNNRKGERVVVNCSLFVLIPYDDKHFRKDLAKRFPNAFPWNDDEGLKNWLKEQAKFSEPTFELFHTPDSTVVAAAGNDWHHGGAQNQERPLTRYPAAFDSVLGVGAMEDVGQHRPAYYSNHDDNPETLGVSAFGGGLNDGKGKDRQGMIGVYISPDFPDTKRPGNKLANYNGWARWAGTSFATPLVSGLVAAIMSDPLVPHTTDAPATMIRDALYSTQVGTENMLEVTQS